MHALPQILAALLSFAGAPLFRVDPVPAEMVQKITAFTWHKGCPVAPADLRAVTVSYWDYNYDQQQGVLIVHKDVADEAMGLFRQLFDDKFPIASVSPVENFGGSDEASMAANNTSAFNCRDTTGRPGVFSNHSWGRAIDINPLTNPYVKGDIVLPPLGREYLNRTQTYPGFIGVNGLVVKIFEAAGWTWGGRWKDRQDYQHFEKPAR